MHKSAEWLQFVYLIKYHFVEMHGSWGWGRGLQRLWGMCGADAQMVHRASRPIHSVVTAGIPDSSVSALLKVANSFRFFNQGPVNI